MVEGRVEDDVAPIGFPFPEWEGFYSVAFVCDGVEVDFYFGGGVVGNVNSLWGGAAVCYSVEERVGDAEYVEHVG